MHGGLAGGAGQAPGPRSSPTQQFFAPGTPAAAEAGPGGSGGLPADVDELAAALGDSSSAAGVVAVDSPRPPAGRRPDRRRLHEPVLAAARRRGDPLALRTSTVPAKPRWLLAIPDAISQLEQLDRQLLTRRDIERLFGVGKPRS